MAYKTILVISANRGFGLELVRQYSAYDSVKTVFATCSSESRAPDLKQLAAMSGKVKILELDVTRRELGMYEKIVDEVTKNCGTYGLNLLVNNAGVLIEPDFHNAKRGDMLELHEVGVVSLFSTNFFTPLLRASSRAGHKTFVANISFEVRSTAYYDDGLMYAYRTCKKGFNQTSKSLSIKLKADNIIVAAIHPGWIQTDMGGPNAPIDLKTSVEHMIKTFGAITPDQAGLLLNYDGTVIPY